MEIASNFNGIKRRTEKTGGVRSPTRTSLSDQIPCTKAIYRDFRANRSLLSILTAIIHAESTAYDEIPCYFGQGFFRPEQGFWSPPREFCPSSGNSSPPRHVCRSFWSKLPPAAKDGGNRRMSGPG